MLDSAKPEEMGFSPTRLARIRKVMQRYVDEQKLAGTVTLVARRERVVHLECCGMMEIETRRAMQPDTIFRIYSMTKPVTSAALLMLVEEGRVRITDPVSQYIPSFKKMQVMVSKPNTDFELVPSQREITLRDLLTHTSGLSYGFEEHSALDELYRQRVWKRIEDDPDLSLAAIIEEIARLPLAHQPGSAFRYSMATDVVAFVVQIVSGKPFNQFLRERIFDPLGMKDTDFFVPAVKRSRFSAVYGPAENGGLKLVDDPNNSVFNRPNRHPSGGGGLVSTASDYLRFAQMLLNQGTLDGERLLGRKTVAWMMSNHLPPHLHPFDDPAFGFGLGGSVLTELGQSPYPGSPGNFSWSGAANTRFWVDPQEQLVGILLTQFMPCDTYPVSNDFMTLVYQALGNES